MINKNLAIVVSLSFSLSAARAADVESAKAQADAGFSQAAQEIKAPEPCSMRAVFCARQEVLGECYKINGDVPPCRDFEAAPRIQKPALAIKPGLYVYPNTAHCIAFKIESTEHTGQFTLAAVLNPNRSYSCRENGYQLPKDGLMNGQTYTFSLRYSGEYACPQLEGLVLTPLSTSQYREMDKDGRESILTSLDQVGGCTKKVCLRWRTRNYGRWGKSPDESCVEEGEAPCD